MQVLPQTLALVLCDAIHRDPGTGKPTLLGLCSGLTARTLPAKHPQLAVYAVLTEAYAPFSARVVVVRADGQTILASTEMPVEVASPRQVAELCITFPDLPIPAAEELRVQLWAAGTLLSERRLQVMLVDPAKNT